MSILIQNIMEVIVSLLFTSQLGALVRIWVQFSSVQFSHSVVSDSL